MRLKYDGVLLYIHKNRQSQTHEVMMQLLPNGFVVSNYNCTKAITRIAYIDNSFKNLSIHEWNPFAWAFFVASEELVSHYSSEVDDVTET